MKFSKQLSSWYSVNKRDLPWRRTKDPYLVWLSEIILQQTRIGQGTPYYERFVAAFPSVSHLAAAGEQEILRLWQGLGYYSRARNLHFAAQTIMKELDGKFPVTYPAIRSLKGIGDYTAAAIASICFDLPHPVMDGNVLRFISRLSGITESIDLSETRKKILAIVTEHIDHMNPGDFNQAMMEFGAMVCTPANPDCTHCIFKKDCIALNNNAVDKIPARNSKAIIRDRFIHYLVVTFTDHGTEFIYLNKRTGNDIWKNLYDFPFEEGTGITSGHLLPEQEFKTILKSAAPVFREVSGPYIHLLTHQKLHVMFYRFHFDTMIELPYTMIALMDIAKYPIPKLIERYLPEIFSEKVDK